MPRHAVVLAAAFAALAAALSAAAPAADPAAPVARLTAPHYASDIARGPIFRLRLAARGSGIEGMTLEFRSNSNVSTRWRRVGPDKVRRTARFRGRPGETYRFRLRARDTFGNRSPYSYGITSVPRDDRSPRLRFTGGWRRLRSAGAYEGTLRRAQQPGATASLLFRGGRLALIARRSPGAGRLLVQIAGREEFVSLRGRRRGRAVVFRSRLLRPGVYRPHLIALGGGPVDLDAVAIEQGPRAPR
ncbi:MAG: fibronectin type III domain-containing protein [Actinomycetota bacterium]